MNMNRNNIKTRLQAAFVPLLALLLIALAVFTGGQLLRPTTARAESYPTHGLAKIEMTQSGSGQMFEITVPYKCLGEYDSYTLGTVKLYRLTDSDELGALYAFNAGAFYPVSNPNYEARFSKVAVKTAFPDTVVGTAKYRLVITYNPPSGGAPATVQSTAHSLKYQGMPLPVAPELEGHTFEGWYLDEARTQPYDGREVTADLDLYPKYVINTYQVTFDSAGGNEVAAITVEWNKAATLPTPIRAGYNFLGWFLSDDTHYVDQPIKAQTALTAKWQIQTFTVTFHTIDGKVLTTLTVEYGMTLYEAMAANGLVFYSVKSVAALDGSALEDFSRVTGELSVTIAEQTGLTKAWTFVKINWIWFAAGGGALLLVCVIGGIVAKKHKKA